MEQSHNVDLTLSHLGSAVSALQQPKRRFLKLQSASHAKLCLILRSLPNSGSAPCQDWIRQEKREYFTSPTKNPAFNLVTHEKVDGTKSVAGVMFSIPPVCLQSCQDYA